MPLELPAVCTCSICPTAAQQQATAAPVARPELAAALDQIAGKLLTPPVRYSQPGLQAHITYLYGMDTRADQQVGGDSKARLRVLRAELAALTAALDAAIGRR
jgi:hypothetical protein